MRNLVFHYTAVITPFVFISSIFGARTLLAFFLKDRKGKERENQYTVRLAGYIIVCAVIFAYFKGPLPFSREKEIHPFKYPQVEYQLVQKWENILKSESLKVSSTGQLAPHFTSRRYFYTFSDSAVS